MNDITIATLRKTMRGHKSQELRSTLHELNYELKGVTTAKLKLWKEWAKDNVTASITEYKLNDLNDEEYRLTTIITAICEELDDRRVYWNALHAPKTGFTLEDRAHLRV